VKLSYLVPRPGEGRPSAHTPLEVVDVPTGETTVVNFDQSGAELIIRLEWPPGVSRGADQVVMAIVRTPFPSPPQEVIGNLEATRAWLMQPEIQALAAKAKHFTLQEDANGTWKADDVKPGAYRIGITVFKPGNDQGMGQTLLVGTKEVVIEDGANESIDCGIVPLTPPKTVENAGVSGH
jgi:hypothetical protein